MQVVGIMTTQVRIRLNDQQLYNDFQAYLLEKYGTTRGVTSSELERALYLLLKNEKYGDYGDVKNTHHNRDPQGYYTHKKLKPRQIKFLKAFDERFINDDKISNSVLKEFIMSAVNVDDYRAIRNWIKFLKRNGWIQEIPRMSMWINTFPHLTWKEELLKESVL
jgi:hypothetical protein